MRKRYVFRAVTTYSTEPYRSTYDYSAEPIHLVGMTVHEPEPMVYETGILDADGNPIRYEEIREPIGFVHARSECA